MKHKGTLAIQEVKDYLRPLTLPSTRLELSTENIMA